MKQYYRENVRKEQILSPTHGLFDDLQYMSFQCFLTYVMCPCAQVKDLKALLQHDRTHFEEEMCEEGEKNITVYKNVKDSGSTRVSRDIHSSQIQFKPF